MVEEHLRRIAVDERDVVVVAEHGDDLLGLALPQQPVVDEDAGQPVADRLVQQHRDDRRVDAAGQAADHLAVATHLRPDAGDGLVLERGHRPVAGAAANPVGEIAEQFRAMRRVDDLEMELDTVKPARIIGDGGIGGAVAGADHTESLWDPLDPVAMAHPHLLAVALCPNTLKQVAIIDHIDEGAPEFLVVGIDDLAAQLRAYGLLAIADAEHRQAEIEGALGRARRGHLGDAGRAARQDDSLRPERLDRGTVQAVVRMDLAVDAGLAHPAGDQLGHLASEIDDEDAVGHGLVWRSAGANASDVSL